MANMKYVIGCIAVVLLISTSLLVFGCSSSRTVWVNESVDEPPYDVKLLYEGENLTSSCSVSPGSSRAVQMLVNAEQVEECIVLERLDLESQNKLRNLDFHSNRVAIATKQYLSGGKVSFRTYETDDNELTLDFVERKPGGCGSNEIKEKQFIFIVKVYVSEKEGL